MVTAPISRFEFETYHYEALVLATLPRSSVRCPVTFLYVLLFRTTDTLLWNIVKLYLISHYSCGLLTVSKLSAGSIQPYSKVFKKFPQKYTSSDIYFYHAVIILLSNHILFRHFCHLYLLLIILMEYSRVYLIMGSLNTAGLASQIESACPNSR
jgi:hypothetical protein